MPGRFVNPSDQTVDMFHVLYQVCQTKLEKLGIYACTHNSVPDFFFPHVVISVLHHRPRDPLVGASLRPLSFNNNTHRFPWSAPAAGPEIIVPAERSLVPPTGHSLIPHHQPIHPWPPLTASFAKYSFCCVQVVAGGGGGVVRSRYSQKGWSVKEGKYHQRACALKGMEVFGIPDYICQGNETEQKLCNIKLFRCIPHVLNNGCSS